MPWGRHPKQTFNRICRGIVRPIISKTFFFTTISFTLHFSVPWPKAYTILWDDTISNITNIYKYTEVFLIKLLPGPLMAEKNGINEAPRMKSVSTLMSLHVQEPNHQERSSKSINSCTTKSAPYVTSCTWNMKSVAAKVSTHVPRRVHSIATRMSLHAHEPSRA